MRRMGMLLLKISKYNQVRELSMVSICLFHAHLYSLYLAAATFFTKRLLKRHEECVRKSVDSLQ